MSADLKDFRCKLTVEAHCVLEAESRVTGEDKSEIVRKIVHDYAVKKLQCAKIADGLLRSEGMGGIAEGALGKMREKP